MVKIFTYDENPTEFSANTYVVGKIGANCIVIDLGSTDPQIYDYIDTHYEKCVGILLTHAHFDHIRGVPAFLKHYRAKYDIPVYLNIEDLELLTDPKLNSSTALTGENVQMNLNPILVEDGMNLELSKLKIKVLETPFHTEGSVCYLLENENALFTGDTLFKGSIGRTDMPTSSPEKVKSSLNKLKSLNPYLVIYPGHGPMTRLDVELKENPFLK